MKSSVAFSSASLLRRGRSQILLGVALVLAFSTASMSRAADTPVAPEPKSHTLFMGMDFSVEYKRALYRVVDVVGEFFVIQVDGKEVRVPMNHGAGKFRIEPGLKLTEVSASVGGLKGQRTYTPANDPDALFLKGLAKSELQFADSMAAQNQANAGFHFDDPASAAAAAAARADPRLAAALAPAGGQVTIAQVNAQLNVQRIAGGPGSRYLAQGAEADAVDAYDAVEVDFDISPERPLDRPYVVIVVQFRPANGDAGKVNNWVYAQALQPMGGEPAKVQVNRGGFTPTFTAHRVAPATKVHVMQGGFPKGFELQDYQVHLYDHGQEVATNVSPKRVPLTRDEAFEYVRLQYIGSHKGATLPAVPAMGRLPADLPDRLAKGEFGGTVYVKVTPEGRGSGLFHDRACAEHWDDAYLTGLVQNLRFQPALEKGRPIEGVAALNLAKLVL